MSLAALIVDAVPPDRFARIRAAVQKQFGFILTGTTGVVTVHGVEVSYSYDGTSTLDFAILKVPSIFGAHLVAPETVVAKLKSALAEIS